MITTAQRRSWGVIAALALACAACSSTNRASSGSQPTPSDSPSALATPGASGGPSGSASPAPSVPGHSAGPIAGTGGGASGSTGGGTAGGTTGTVHIGGQAIKISHGLVNGKLQIGFEWADASQISATFGAVGGFNAPVGDNKTQEQAVVNYVNAHGGIDGFKIDPIFYKLNVANLETNQGRAQESQAACAQWTQDHHVFAMVVIANPNDNLLNCAKNSNTPILTANGAQFVDDVAYASMPNLLFSPSFLTADDRERLEVQRMVASHVLNPNTKLGLLISGGSPMLGRAADRTLIPLLQHYDIKVVKKIVYPDDINSPWSSYVLQFQQAGADTVYFGSVDGAFWSQVFFFKAATQQQYYPSYVLGSDIATSGNSSDQAKKVHGAGWMPYSDVGSTALVSSNAVTCDKIMKAAGQPTFDLIDAGPATCELMFFLQAALQGSTQITPAGLGAGATRLGKGFGTIMTRGADFGTGHYAAAVVQDFAYNAACDCVAYVGRPAWYR